ncbi:hypothetical protein AK812_SmicGene39471 [Symbiodinium microadriaticum]|uniref:Uncharacterized protein n=1 Tax=Symbiodinium microadriaticum TaxID=2951 RepID=A0A1Q9CB47_SYMMI|nr:hypothetical protein AK812_SmicGene39471 [Symbiodinium microadriaticum]
MEWGAYRAIKKKSSRSNWAEHLLDTDNWEGDLHKHMTSIFAKRPADATRVAMQQMRDECSLLCKGRPGRPFSEAEMRITMAKWKRHKATGTDGISLEALQLLFEDARWRPRIAELINDSLYKGELTPWVAEGAQWWITASDRLLTPLQHDMPEPEIELLALLVGSLWFFQGGAGPSPSPYVIDVDSSGDSDLSDVPWAPLEPEPPAVPRALDADEVMDMPVPEPGVIPELHEPEAPPQPPQRLSRDYENNELEYKDTRQEPFNNSPFEPRETNHMMRWTSHRQLPQHSRPHNNNHPTYLNKDKRLNLMYYTMVKTHDYRRGMRPQRPGSPGLSEATTCAGDDAPTDCIDEEVAPEEARDAATTGETPPEDATEPAEVPMDHDEEHEPTGNQDDDDDWESDTSDSEVEAENDEPESTTPTTGKKTPKRAAGHGSQRLANKAKKSDVKKRWRELEWGDKPKWLSWRGALLYIQRGEKPPARQPLPPTPSPQREHLLSLLSAHHYSYDSQGNIVPHHPPRPRHDGPLENSEKDLLPPPGRTETTTKEARLHKFEHNHNKTIDYHNNSTNLIKFEHSHSKTTDYHNNSPNLINDKPGGDPTNKFSSTYQLNTVKNLLDLFGDGVYNYPVQIVDNRPSRPQEHHTAQGMASRDNDNDHSLNNHLHNIEADTLVVQPLHLTEPTDPSSSSSSSAASHPTPPRDQGTMTHSGGPPLPSMDDLDQQAAAAVAEGRAPAWQIEGDDAALSQLWAHAANATPTTTTTLMPGDMNSLVQQRRPTPTTSTSEEQARGMPPPRRDPPQPPQPPSGPASQPVEHENPWYSVAANFNGEFTVSGLLRLLQKILHEMLQQTFAMPNEYITHLAYHSCYYISKLMSTNDRQLQRQEQGDAPSAANDLGPTAMVFCITNPFVEAEAALDSLVQHQRDLPRRHLLRELRRAEALLKDGRAIFKSWSRNPNAPGALPGTAASQNALDGVDFSFLASEEGGVASLDESLRIALAAAQRCSHYMNQLLGWIQGHFQAENAGGSPSPKKRRMERPSGSDCRPDFTTAPSNTTLPAHNHTGELPRDVPVRPDDPRRPDSALPHRDPSGAVPGAAPYNILRAQQLLESVMPFTEQEVATSLQEVHSLLFQWTSSLYGASP